MTNPKNHQCYEFWRDCSHRTKMLRPRRDCSHQLWKLLELYPVMSLSRLRSQLEYNSNVSDLNMSLHKNTVVLSDSKAWTVFVCSLVVLHHFVSLGNFKIKILNLWQPNVSSGHLYEAIILWNFNYQGMIRISLTYIPVFFI
jgi:hypothetical protein